MLQIIYKNDGLKGNQAMLHDLLKALDYVDSQDSIKALKLFHVYRYLKKQNFVSSL